MARGAQDTQQRPPRGHDFRRRWRRHIAHCFPDSWVARPAFGRRLRGGPNPIAAIQYRPFERGSLMGVDSAQLQKREPELYARLMGQIGEWLESGTL